MKHKIHRESQARFLLLLGTWCFFTAWVLGGLLLLAEPGIFDTLYYRQTAYGLWETAPALFLVCMIGGFVFDIYEKSEQKT